MYIIDDHLPLAGFVVKYSSEGNIQPNEVFLMAKTLQGAQDKFLNWLREKPLYAHMWKLNMEVRKVELID